MVRIIKAGAITTAATACVIGVLSPVHRATAGPGESPTPGESSACEQAWTPPTDPQVNMHYGLGMLAFYGWVHEHCAGVDATFPNGAVVAGSGLESDIPA